MYGVITFWPRTCSELLLVDLVTLGPKKFQNKAEPFASTVRLGENSPKVMLQHWFYKTMENGETDLRSWLLYSKANNSLYCFYCHLFLKTKQRKSSLARNPGFQNFWKLNSKMPEHENLSDHQRAFKEWKMLEMTFNKGKTFDS